jgi:hypothetical protein
MTGLVGAEGASGVGTTLKLDFWQNLPPPVRSYLADDIKLLVGWTFDAAVSQGSPDRR